MTDMKISRILTFSLALAAFASLTTACGGNKYKSMTEVSADADSAAAAAEQVAPLTAVQSPLDSATMAKYNAAFFENTANKAATPEADKWVETQSGLKYTILKEGEGVSPTATDEVTVHYVGQLTNGKVFDSSISRGEPTSFPLNGVIPGWTEGLQLMKPGGVAIFYIPGKLAYGERGAGADIGPNETLLFGVQLISVNAQ